MATLPLRSSALWKSALLVVTFLAGFALGGVLPSPFSRAIGKFGTSGGQTLRITNKYDLIAPLLMCDTSDSKTFEKDTSLQSAVQKVVDDEKAKGDAADISVYFRYLQSGREFGINENQKYAPASLLKVPMMIAYFKEAESNPAILSQLLTYDGSVDFNANETFKSLNDIKPGVYKVSDLLIALIVNSDNNALALLKQHLDPSALNNVYTDLGLSVPSSASADVDFMSAKQYSYFFRILYNGTYLSPQYSERAMELLAGPDFPQGITSAVPSQIKVAQKFGERSVYSPSGAVLERDLHDCGIIYYPNRPYLLCVMSKGTDFHGLLTVIQKISGTVYTTVSGSTLRN